MQIKDNIIKNARILIVEDDQAMQKLNDRILSQLDHKTYCADNGKQALEMVAEVNPDLILMDANMPLIDGFEATRQIKSDQNTMGIPIIMITGISDTTHRVKALDAGVDDFLAKPPEKAEIIATICSQLKVKAYNDSIRDYQHTLEQAVSYRTDQLNHAMAQLKDTTLEIIHRLATASEYRDEDTGAHLQRMSNYAAIVAKKMGLGFNTVESILHAAPMHDIGKIGIPDSILLKPGKLTTSEWELMQEHPNIGYKILRGSKIPLVRTAGIIALTHHEKWNGKGYPQGLKGKKIPLVGRITAIADVFDALTSKRPYKPAFEVDKSIEIVKKESGQHFDPDVVEAFLACRDDLLTIKEKYTDTSESRLIQMIDKTWADVNDPSHNSQA